MSNVLKFPGKPAAPKCLSCDREREELGVHCRDCRDKQLQMPMTMIHSSVAGLIRELELAVEEHRSLPATRALTRAKLVYEAMEPYVRDVAHISKMGVVLFDSLGFWARPEGSSSEYGPFPTLRAAEDKLAEERLQGTGLEERGGML